jgi:hypothetical protein
MAEFDPNLNDILDIQEAFDKENFSGADSIDGKRTHISLHLGKLVGKYASTEEQGDHGHIDDSSLTKEVAPDLLVYAAQLASYTGSSLHGLYVNHVRALPRRYSISDQYSFDRISITNLAELQKGADDYEYRKAGVEDSVASERRFIYFGLLKPIAYLATVERKEFIEDGDIERIEDLVIPRFVRSAIQIANLKEANLAELYKSRLEYVAQRNGTGIDSAHRAMGITE